jgi:hypothetical protein
MRKSEENMEGDILILFHYIFMGREKQNSKEEEREKE